MTTSATSAAPRIRTARLAGPSVKLDPRVNAVRADLADAALAAVTVAPRYADPVTLRCVAASSFLRAGPDDAATAVSELLFGEDFKVFDIAGGWAWGQCAHDAYVGWVRQASLAQTGDAMITHRVGTPAATVFGAPDIKSRVLTTLPLNARLAATAGDFMAAAGCYVHRRHVRDIDDFIGDPVALAFGFVGSPYVWGGRTRAGIDCSGLTQAVLQACGAACPRDADQQRDAFREVADSDRRRGDLAFFPGHVGLLVDPDTIIHANAYWMATVVEPLADVAARVALTGFGRPSL